ncbi:cupin domain-containing protein [Streptomyces sp. NPDC020983]|uniref:cupin domain-containing protein n=1 Tax=Streptomyces sp. NPDC020983 TaxID=3365106 RepID=UPI0037A846A8
MSLIVPGYDGSAIVRSTDTEVVGRAPTTAQLLADSSATGGALSTLRITLLDGADGAPPHRHNSCTEMLYLLDGTAHILSADQVLTARTGDLVVVPPGRPHAFAAAPGSNADLLVVVTPGVERFGYFHHLQRIALGQAPPESLLEVQEAYDTYFLQSTEWNTARRAVRHRSVVA